MTTDIIVGFPGETEDDFERTLEVAAEAEYDSAYTFIYSPRPGTEAADRLDDFVDPDVVGERFERLRVVIERSATAKHAARVGRTEEVVVEGPARRDPTLTSGRTRQNKLVHFAVDGALRPGTVRRRRDHRGRRPPPAGRPARGHRRPPSPHSASRWSRAEPRPAPGPGRDHGVGQVGPGPRAGPGGRRHRDLLGGLDAGLPGHGHRHGQAQPGRAGRGPAPPARPGRARRGLHPRRVPGGHGRRPGRASRPGATGPSWSAAPALYLRAVVDGLDPAPRRYPEVRAELEAEPDTAALHARLVALDPVAATRMEPTNRRRVVRALEVTIGSGRPFSAHGPGLDGASADAVPSRRAVAAPGGRGRPHPGPVRAPGGRRLRGRGRAPCWPAPPGSLAPPVRRWATAS